MHLKVIKADGNAEEYLHTKIIGTINHALSVAGLFDIEVTEHLAEAVTYYIYNKQKSRTITSNEILSMIKVVLTATNYEDAAIALSEHNFNRRLKRSRIEVVAINIQKLADAESLCKAESLTERCRWDKTRIVDNLVTKHDLGRHTARMIASMVEEKILSMNITLVPVSLIRQLVLNDTAAVLRAERQLQIA